MSEINRQWILASRPSGRLSVDCFEYREIAAPADDLAPNRLLVRNRALQHAPVLRGWMGPPRGTYPSMPLGKPVMSPTASEILVSTDPRFPVGGLVFTQTAGWQDYAIVDTTHPWLRLCPQDATLEECIGVFGGNQLTAYFGLKKVGELRPGETLVVSGAAGSTGSWAAQIGKIIGARVIGIAGGADKCRWLLDTCHLDAAIDYKSEPVAERLRELCPKGIDVFFDNVGGDILQAAIENIAVKGRIALCGQISGYDTADEVVKGPNDMMRLIYRQVKMQGFSGMAWPHEIPEAIADIKRWIKGRRIVHREDVRHGFENVPKDFLSLFDGSNHGTLMTKL